MGDEISGDGGDNYSSGGVGDDVYVVDGCGDAIVDGIEQGRDTVRSSADWWLGVGLQNLVLTGSDAVKAAVLLRQFPPEGHRLFRRVGFHLSKSPDYLWRTRTHVVRPSAKSL